MEGTVRLADSIPWRTRSFLSLRPDEEVQFLEGLSEDGLAVTSGTLWVARLVRLARQSSLLFSSGSCGKCMTFQERSVSSSGYMNSCAVLRDPPNKL